MALVGFAGGAWLAHRALRPIRNLSGVARSIVDTGRFDTRVPGNRTGDELNELALLFNQMLEKIEVLIRGMKDALDRYQRFLMPMHRIIQEVVWRRHGEWLKC